VVTEKIEAIWYKIFMKNEFYYLVTTSRLNAIKAVAPRFKVRVKVIAGPGTEVKMDGGFRGVVNNDEVYIQITTRIATDKVNAEEIINASSDEMVDKN
jgi:hypothetical protein